MVVRLQNQISETKKYYVLNSYNCLIYVHSDIDGFIQKKNPVSTLNSNSSGIKKQLNAGESAYIYINDGNGTGGIVLISVWRETANLRGIYMAQPGNGNNTNQYQESTVIALKELSSISVEAAVDSKYSSVKITNNHTSAVCVRAVSLCGSQPEWIS